MQSPNRRSLILTRRVATALLLAATPASAAEPGDLGTVWVFARVPQPIAQVAASISAADETTVKRELAQNLRDVARYTPGLSLPSDPARFGLDTIKIRGIGGNRVLIETDGVPTPAGFAIGNFSNAGRPFADLDLVKRIEIMRGPASALYGSDAIGGVVSSRTVSPADLLAHRDAALRVRAGYASADHSSLASMTGAMRGPSDVEALVAYARREGAELQNGPVALKPNPADYARDTMLAKLVLAGMDHPLAVTLGATRYENVTLVNSDVLQAGRFANTTYMRGNDRDDSQRLIIDQSFMSSGRDSAEWRAYWQQSRTDQRTVEKRRAAPPTTPALDISRDFAFRDVTLGAQATLIRELRLSGISHRLVLGGEFEHHRIEERRDGLQTTLPSGAVTNVILGETLPLRDFPQTTQTQAGVYVHDEIRTRAAQVEWIPAVRVDYYRLRPTVDTLYANGNPGQVPVSINQSAVSPRLGMTWQIAEGRTLFGQYAHGFRSPPFSDVNIGLYLPQFNVRAIPNPDLRPEKSDGFELGLRSTTKAVEGSVSAFYTRYRDFIQSKVNIGPDSTGVTLFQSRNVARATIWGVEAEGRLRAAAWVPALAAYSVRYAVSYARGDDRARSRPLNSIDPARAVIGLVYDAPGGDWGAQLVTTTVAAKSRVDNTPTTLARTSGFTIVDLVGHWQATAKLDVEAGVFNLTNRSYFEWTDVSARAATDPLLDLYRRPGRNASVSVAYRW
jgi:hemoglobin/transferrin/lactoferrin receptor protein